MLSLYPKLVFLSSSSVFFLFFFSRLTVKVSVEHWPAVWAILSPVPQRLHSGRGLPTLFQQKLDGYVGRGGPPPLSPPLQEKQDCSGHLAAGPAVTSGQDCLGTLQHVKLCSQNVMSILTTAPKYWASTSQLCSEPQDSYICVSLPKYRWKFISSYIEDVFF